MHCHRISLVFSVERLHFPFCVQINSSDFQREQIFSVLVLITEVIMYGEFALMFKHYLCAKAALNVLVYSQ